MLRVLVYECVHPPPLHTPLVRVHKEKWLSGRRRQAVNLLVKLSLVRIQLFSSILTKNKRYKISFNKISFLKNLKPKLITSSVNILTKNNFFWKKNNPCFHWIFTQNVLYYAYKFNLLQPLMDFNNALSFKKAYFKNRLFNVRLKFRFNKIRISLEHDLLRHQYFSLVPGLLIKGFNHKKSIKNSYTIKFLLMKLLRKLLIVLQVSNLNLILKGTPTRLPQYVRTLLTPITHYLVNPISNTLYDEITQKPFEFNIHSVLFLKCLLLKKQKLRKKGRVKRKILRKLILKNKLID